MEITVIQDHIARDVCIGHYDILVEDKFQRWVVGQVAFHLDAAVNRRLDHVPGRIEEDVNFLINVHEYLVGFIFAD